MSITSLRTLAACLGLALLGAPVLATSDPCSPVQHDNPVTGRTERVWHEHDGEDFEILWAERIGGQWVNGIALTDNDADDTCPDLAVALDGSSAVVWRASEAAGRIYYAGRKLIGELWTWQPVPVPVSDGTRNASMPRVTFHTGLGPHVVWCEHSDSNEFRIIGGGDHSDPWPLSFVPSEIGRSTYDGSPDLEIESQQGYMWTVWIDSNAELGYAEFLSGWGPAQYTPYYGPSDVEDAKKSLESAITGL